MLLLLLSDFKTKIDLNESFENNSAKLSIRIDDHEIPDVRESSCISFLCLSNYLRWDLEIGP